MAPGGTITGLAVASSLRSLCPPRSNDAEKAERVQERNPLRIATRSQDHVAAYVLLASDRSRAITGTVSKSDGGLGVRGMAPGDR